ncbi:MAG: P-loop NTPase [Spirochaetota bacterium]
MIQNERNKRKIIPVASGKGGVGKSVFSANLALRLATAGAETVVIDLDLGGSNLHTYLGLRNTREGIGNMLSVSGKKLADFVHESGRENLRYVPGDVLVSGMTRLSASQRKRIVDGIESLKADYVILDLGSGTNELVIDTFLISNSGVVVSTPQAPSALNAYALLKNVLFYRLKSEFAASKQISSYLKSVQKERRPGATPNIDEIFAGIKKIDSRAATRAKKRVAELKPLLVTNMVNSSGDYQMLASLRKLISDNLGIDPASLGAISNDSTCQQALAALEPVTEFAPTSVISYQIERVAQKILQSERFPEMPLDLESYADSYELTRIEMEDDEQQFGPAGGDYTSEYIEVIAKQKQEIEQLKRTLRMVSTGTGQEQ